MGIGLVFVHGQRLLVEDAGHAVLDPGAGAAERGPGIVLEVSVAAGKVGDVSGHGEAHVEGIGADLRRGLSDIVCSAGGGGLEEVPSVDVERVADHEAGWVMTGEVEENNANFNVNVNARNAINKHKSSNIMYRLELVNLTTGRGREHGDVPAHDRVSRR